MKRVRARHMSLSANNRKRLLRPNKLWPRQRRPRRSNTSVRCRRLNASSAGLLSIQPRKSPAKYSRLTIKNASRKKPRARLPDENQQRDPAAFKRNVARQFYGWAARSRQDCVARAIANRETAASFHRDLAQLQTSASARDRKAARADRERDPT